MLGYSVTTSVHTAASGADESRAALVQIGIAGACAMNTMMLAVSLYQGLFTGIEAPYETLFRWVSLALSVPVVGYCALPIYQKGIGALRAGTLHIDLPITLGIGLSFILSALNTITGHGEIYFDSVTAIIFLLLSTRYLHRHAFERARRACSSRWSLLPATIRVVSESGGMQEIPLAELQPGMKIEVKPGERIPCDGTIDEGESSLDCSTITGESLPVAVARGAAVLAGSLNIDSPLRVLSATHAGASRLERIVATIADTITQPPRFITALDTLSMLFTASALLLASGAFLFSLNAGLQVATSAAIAMLTVTCPCAVALALPLLSIRALSFAAERGILVKSPDVFETLPVVRHTYLDKTGTVTHGTPTVSRSHKHTSLTDAFTYSVLAHLTQIDPHHPVSQAIRRWLPTEPREPLHVLESKRIPGAGVSMTFEYSSPPTHTLATLGSLAFHRAQHTTLPDDIRETLGSVSSSATIVVLSIGNHWAYIFELVDSVREEARAVVQTLRARGGVHLLSGDRAEVTRTVGRALDIDDPHAQGELLPAEKAAIVSSSNGPTLYVGDGANDAPALHAATIGIALRGGIQSILESADVFITNGGIERISALQQIAARYRARSRSIVGLGLVYNATGIGAAFLGYVSPLVAAIAMPIFSSILVILAYSAFTGLLPTSTTQR